MVFQTYVPLRTAAALAIAAAGDYAKRKFSSIEKVSKKSGESLGIKEAFPESYTLTKQKKRMKAKVAKKKPVTKKQVERMLASKMETKQFSNTAQNATMTDDNIYTHNVTAQVQQSNIDGGRQGDSINLKRLKINGNFKGKITSGYYVCRLLVLYSSEEFNPSATGLSSAGLGVTQIFSPNYASSTIGNAICNSKAVTILADKTLYVNSNIDGVMDAIPFTIDINLRGVKFNYQSSGAVYGKTKNLYLVAIPNAYDGASNIDAHLTGSGAGGNILFNYVLSYTDS